jgi:hypothetical protein
MFVRALKKHLSELLFQIGRASWLSKSILRMDISSLVKSFFLSDFAQCITELWDSDPPLDIRYRLGDDLSDVLLQVGSDLELRAHWCVLSRSFPLFQELFCFHGGFSSVSPAVEFPFPFPSIFEHLVKFSYIMTSSSFHPADFFSEISFGFPLCQIVLLSVLSYLGEGPVCTRVRSCLTGTEWSSADRAIIAQITEFYASPATVPTHFQKASSQALRAINDVLYQSVILSGPPAFVKPVSGFDTGSADRSSLKSSLDVGYYEIADLSLFFRACGPQADWSSGLFPPGDCRSRFTASSSVKRLMIHPWYDYFYQEALKLCRPKREYEQLIVLGTPGIGKSMFGVYFMSRLVNSDITELHGFPYILVSYLFNKNDTRYIRIMLNDGSVSRITEEEFDAEGNSGVLTILDGSCSTIPGSFPNCLSLISPSQNVRVQAPTVHLYAPTISPADLSELPDISTRYRHANSDRVPGELPLEVYGSIESRVEIVGGNLRLLLDFKTLEELKADLIQSVKSIKFDMNPEDYFTPVKVAQMEPYHRAFASYPVSPYDKAGEVRFLSQWVEDVMIAALFNLRDKKTLETAYALKVSLHLVLGFASVKSTVRGNFFEDLCLQSILWIPDHEYHFEIREWYRDRGGSTRADPPTTVRIPEMNHIRGELHGIPVCGDIPWLWSPTKENFAGIDAVFYTGQKIFLLQMTLNVNHNSLTLKEIWPWLEPWVRKGKDCSIVVLAHHRIDEAAFYDRTQPILLRGLWSKSANPITEYIGLLCEGPVSSDSGAKPAPDEFAQLRARK